MSQTLAGFQPFSTNDSSKGFKDVGLLSDKLYRLQTATLSNCLVGLIFILLLKSRKNCEAQQLGRGSQLKSYLK